MEKVKTSFSMDQELYNSLVDMAKESERSISQQISYLVRKENEIRKSKRGLINNSLTVEGE